MKESVLMKDVSQQSTSLVKSSEISTHPLHQSYLDWFVVKRRDGIPKSTQD